MIALIFSIPTDDQAHVELMANETLDALSNATAVFVEESTQSSTTTTTTTGRAASAVVAAAAASTLPGLNGGANDNKANNGVFDVASCPLINTPQYIDLIYIVSVLTLLVCNTVFLVWIMAVRTLYTKYTHTDLGLEHDTALSASEQ